jgi:hypothetical protein
LKLLRHVIRILTWNLDEYHDGAGDELIENLKIFQEF